MAALTWRDGLDFGLLVLIVYHLLKVVRGTRAVPVLVAVSVFGLLALTVSQLDLIASASLLKYFFESIIILLIVVFQQELRRMLLVLGQRILPSNRREAAQSALSELVAGLERLKRARIGALVVLQGDIDVMSVATGVGTEIDAPLKAETLVALSIPHAANTAHDGAIVVENFRITRAGVILPLSGQTLDPRFGTRHRGALGVSEETDGFVLIISEERGELRIAHRGIISDPLEPAELQARVETWLSTPRNDPTASASSSTLTAGAVLESVGHSAILAKPTGDEATSSRSQTHLSKAAMEDAP
ncbi:MAG: diadenylate cyclase [Nannocystaceae bacterium]|nr:diadenylate cyclase [bacterium]